MFLLLQLLFQTAFATDYCTICENGTHTMCQFKDGPAADCLDYRKVDLSDQMKKYIVDIHNDIRNYVASGQETKGRLGGQPPAADMAQLKWDEELAIMAQRWSDQCIKINATLQHDVCRQTDRFDVGQNILTAITTDTKLPELADLILNWYKQVTDVIPSDIQFFSGIRRGQLLIGQYTQLVWAKTEYVGCGLSIFRESKENKFFYQRLVCNYGPAGNVIGWPTYQIGRPCSGCPSKECDMFKRSLCRGEEMSGTPSMLPLNLKEFVSSKMDSWICFINRYETPEQKLDNCLNLTEDFLNQNKSEISKVDPFTPVPSQLKSTVLEIMEGSSTELHRSSHIINFLGKNSYNPYLINLMQRIKATIRNADDLNSISDKVKLEQRSGNKDRIKPFGNIQNNAYQLRESDKQLLMRNDEVVFPNKIHFRRERGIWIDGHCRCNRIYRSSCDIYRAEISLLLFIIIFTNTLRIFQLNYITI